MNTVSDDQNAFAYHQASQRYWDELIDAVRTDFHGYNNDKPAQQQLDFADTPSARSFSVRHAQRNQSPSEVTRHSDQQPHTIHIQCVVSGVSQEVELRLRNTDIAAHLANSKELTVSDLVRTILEPLKKVGVLPTGEEDQQPSQPLDYEFL